MKRSIADLVPGDAIVSARKDGSLAIDTVSRFSLATHDSFGPFLEVSTADQAAVPTKPLRLTRDHHLPAGETCCSNVIQAKELVVGETIWRSSEAGELVAATVTGLKYVHDAGHINPLLVNGGFPVVDGVVTTFNTNAIVAFDSVAVPIVEAFCEATGTWDATRRVIAAVECAAKHAFTAKPTCKTYHYIDGLIVSSPTAADAAAGLAPFAVAVLAVGLAILRARK